MCIYTCRLLTLQISVLASIYIIFFVTVGGNEVYIIQGTKTSHTCKRSTGYVRILVVSCVWVGSCMYTYSDDSIPAAVELTTCMDSCERCLQKLWGGSSGYLLHCLVMAASRFQAVSLHAVMFTVTIHNVLHAEACQIILNIIRAVSLSPASW